jgi:NAD(P)-dependent dehydrogenase (short-subunit alcohol dehydrogenase family)
VLARRLDVTDPASVEQVAADLNRRHGRLDVLVNNAAIQYNTWQRASTADLQVVREALEVNLLGAWQTSPILLPLLRASRHGASSMSPAKLAHGGSNPCSSGPGPRASWWSR